MIIEFRLGKTLRANSSKI